MSEQSVDVAIVFALEEEFEQFFPSIETAYVAHTDPKSGRAFCCFDLKGSLGPPYRCVSSFVGTMGAQDTSLFTSTILERYRPRTIVLIGLAGSLDSDVLVGDVVVADEVDDYLQDGKVEDGCFVPAGRSYRPHVRLNNLLRYFRITQRPQWTKLTEHSVERFGQAVRGRAVGGLGELVRTDGFRCLNGHLASGPLVGASTMFAAWLKSTFDRKYLALDMESAGFVNAVHQQAGDERVLIVRAISDLSDARKSRLDTVGRGSLRRAAMDNAIELVLALFETGAFERSHEPSGELDARKPTSDLLLRPGETTEALEPVQPQQTTTISGHATVGIQTNIGRAGDIYIGTSSPDLHAESPSLAFVFEPGLSPFVQDDHMFLIDQLRGTVKPTGGITYRVGVKNNGTKTLHQVRVRIVAVHPALTEDVFPLTLRKKDDNDPPYTSSLGFSVHPGETEYVDVVMKSDEQDTVQVQHVVSGVIRDLLPRHCTLTLTAYGEDLMSTPSTKFDVSIGVDGELELDHSA